MRADMWFNGQVNSVAECGYGREFDENTDEF